MTPSPGTPLVLVVVGTDHHPFDRVVGWVDRWASVRDARVVIQYGTSTPPSHAEGHDLVRQEELAALWAEASAVVTHGGPGTIMGARDAGHVPIVVPRRAELGEHVDDHQLLFTARLRDAGQIYRPETEAELHAMLDRAVADPEAFRQQGSADGGAESVARFGTLVDDLVGGAGTGTLAPRVLFVAGWGRSGSTLLDRLLGQVPGTFSVGEVRDIWHRGVIENRLCGCGASFHDCEIWSEVGKEAFGGWEHLNLREVTRLRSRLDRPWAVPSVLTSKASPTRDADVGAYVGYLERLYDAIHRVTGASVIVDSSKIPTYALLLRQVPNIDLRILHLVRDPRGVVYSWQKQVVRADGGGRDEMLRYGVASASARYLFYNGLAHGMRALGSSYRFVRYEDLIADPLGTLRGTLAFAGLPSDAQTLSFLHGRSADLGPNHTVDGNPMRLQTGPIELRPDEAWREGMDPRQRSVVTGLTSPLVAWYRYPVRGRS
jgi:UDP-N-acetylglucosamine transferase subunit ALG13